jgi:hypothetical protein
LFTDDMQAFYAAVGFRLQGDFLSLVSGSWLDNAGNRDED